MLPSLVVVAAAVSVAVGILVASRQRLIGGLLVAQGVSFGLLNGLGASGSGRTHLVVDQLTSGAWVFQFLWLVLVAYLLPDGRAASPFWRRWIAAGLLGVPLLVVGAVGDADGFRAAHQGADPPLAWLPETLSGLLGLVGLLLVVLLIFGSVVAVRSRLRRATGDDRQRLLWLVLGAVTVPAALLVGWVQHFVLDDDPAWLFEAALTVSAVALPVAIGIGVLRHQLFDVQLVLSRTLTYGALTVLVLAVYGVLLGLTDALVGDSEPGGVVAVVLVAIAVHPLYSVLRRRSERWVYGLRSEPAVALRLLADRAEELDRTDPVVAVTDAVAEALRARAVAIGPAGTGTPLVHRGEHLGDLVVDLPQGRSLGAADTALLRDLARYAAVIVKSARLTEEVTVSRMRIVAGREEERRRLRRDLHDGVGPSLAAVLLMIEAAQNRGDDSRGELLVETKQEIRRAIAEIRRLVDDLRPAAIDEVGLLDAIRQRAAALSNGVAVEVEGPLALPALPAAVEVVAFRIASEAMTNVVRHSGASRCRVEVSVDEDLEVVVSDNGRGADSTASSAQHGVGWASMRERAAELGGACTISPRPGGGLVVHAVLPLRTAVNEEVDG